MTVIELRARCLPTMHESHNNKNTFTKSLLHFLMFIESFSTTTKDFSAV